MYIRNILSAILILLFATSASAQIRINEIMASNSSTIEDEQGDYDDWIEIINLGDVSVNFGGYYVSDDPENLTKWQIPTNQSAATTIAPGQFLLIWFDDDTDDGALHVEPKLSADGEFAILIESDGSTIVHSVEFGEQETDISWGATEDGGDTFSFQSPTPGATNSGEVVKVPAEAPTFTLETGFYTGTQVIGISSVSENTEIRYTTNSSVPTENSTLYTGPISLDTSTVVRAIAVGEEFAPSPVSTNTYLFEETHTIPVVSFVMEPDSLWDEEVGMYVFGDPADYEDEWPFEGANFWEEFQYPAHIEFIETNGSIEFEMDAGAEIGGNFSQAFNKKSFILNNNEEYGIDRLEYKLFEENDYEEYDGFGLRAGAEERSRLLNELMYAVNQKWNHRNDMQAYRPVILYLNGEYWGIYNLQERKNDDFVESRYGFEDIDMISDYDEAKDGDFEAYYDMVDTIVDLDASTQEFYEFIDANINLESFTDHWIYQVYTSHGDPNNLRYWSPRNEEGKWHFISHDFDWWQNLGQEPEEYLAKFSFYLETGTYDFWILGKMMENPTYKEYFLKRLADMLNTAFRPENVLALIDSIDTAIEPEIDRDIARWTDGWMTISGESNYNMEYIRDITEDYAVDYPQFLYQEILDSLGVDTVGVMLKQTVNGRAQLNSEIIDARNGDWEGIYFQGTTLEVRSKPEAGFKIEGWYINDELVSTSRVYQIELTDTALTIEARYQEVDDILVINEINYNSSDDSDTGDWIELYNPGETTINLEGWVFRDQSDDNTFAFPAGTSIASEAYLVVVNDAAAFTERYSQVTNVIGEFEFGLGGSSDEVRIYNSNDRLVDFVRYQDEAPWPIEPDGEGFTLELLDTESDNELGESWGASLSRGGTPGQVNQQILDSIEEIKDSPTDFSLSQNYPNPFNPSTNISFSIPQASKVELTVFNVLGQKVHTLVDGNLNAGSHFVTFDASGLTSGVYFYRLVSGNNVATQKMLLMK
ncbi:MAG: CotH kinase family protein [Balneolaceae bacterium]|nr:CotH kinase family protein [Balneolaceae bacterium]MBO6544813.1 CotH kinase family protein [Balneolaceae bacterium]MBO6646209.1 CotH kinase family protein [Balneolaceae bacterium]